MERIKIRFQLKKEKKDKNGYAPLYLILTKNYERKAIICDHFLVTDKRVAKKVLNAQESIRYDIQKLCEKMVSEGVEITPKSVIERYKNGDKKETHTLEEVFMEYMEPLAERVEKRTLSRYKFVLGTFSTIYGKDKPISGINRGHIERYKTLLESKYQNETVISYWKKLKSVIKYAIDCGYMDNNPFASTTIKRERKKIDYLTKDEVDLLVNADLDNQSLQNIADCAVFQVASGLCYADLKNLSKDDLKMDGDCGYIIKERLKTNNTFVSYVLPIGIRIWNKYNGNLPVISNQKYNAYLKVIQDILGIKTNLHTHLFRHTYATLLLNSGVPIHIVQKALGHTSVLITQQFYAHLEESTVVETIKNIMK